MVSDNRLIWVHEKPMNLGTKKRPKIYSYMNSIWIHSFFMLSYVNSESMSLGVPCQNLPGWSETRMEHKIHTWIHVWVIILWMLCMILYMLVWDQELIYNEILFHLEQQRFAAALIPWLLGNSIPGHTTREPPMQTHQVVRVGFELATDDTQFCVFADY